jgi:hypothetical protein
MQPREEMITDFCAPDGHENCLDTTHGTFTCDCDCHVVALTEVVREYFGGSNE